MLFKTYYLICISNYIEEMLILKVIEKCIMQYKYDIIH